jgi:hypothetical protein
LVVLVAMSCLAVKSNSINAACETARYYAQMAYNNTYKIKSVDGKTHHSMVEDTPLCISQINACQSDTSVCASAQSYCNDKLFGLVTPPVPFLLFW